MSALQIYAGPRALDRLRQEGIRQEQFRVMLGASGGPKWFVLFGLDRFLFGEFFAARTTPLCTLGSSAGAWRLCCLGMSDPVSAVTRLATLYSEEQYSEHPTVHEITAKARAMLDGVLGANGAKEIIENPVIQTSIVTVRARTPWSSGFQPVQLSGLALAALANVFSRRGLALFLERVIFSSGKVPDMWLGSGSLGGRAVQFTQQNLELAMLASGSIPMVLEGVSNIPGATRGHYWDGGITDYHFDHRFSEEEGLVLYPHFSDNVIPGWFDKRLTWRHVNEKNYDNVVLLAPSDEFRKSLPYNKIPDRSDFETMETSQRITYWKTVLERSQVLADEFAEMVEHGIGPDSLFPFAARRGR